MNRRRLLALTVTAGSGFIGGCLGGNQNDACRDEENWSPTVEVEQLELAPGEEEILQINAGPMTNFGWRTDLYPCNTNPPVRFDSVAFSTDPDGYVDSCPPGYFWDDCVTVEIIVSVHVASSAEPGQYEFAFSVTENIGENNSESHEDSITVTAE